MEKQLEKQLVVGWAIPSNDLNMQPNLKKGIERIENRFENIEKKLENIEKLLLEIQQSLAKDNGIEKDENPN